MSISCSSFHVKFPLSTGQTVEIEAEHLTPALEAEVIRILWTYFSPLDGDPMPYVPKMKRYNNRLKKQEMREEREKLLLNQESIDSLGDLDNSAHFTADMTAEELKDHDGK